MGSTYPPIYFILILRLGLQISLFHPLKVRMHHRHSASIGTFGNNQSVVARRPRILHQHLTKFPAFWHQFQPHQFQHICSDPTSITTSMHPDSKSRTALPMLGFHSIFPHHLSPLQITACLDILLRYHQLPQSLQPGTRLMRNKI